MKNAKRIAAGAAAALGCCLALLALTALLAVRGTVPESGRLSAVLVFASAFAGAWISTLGGGRRELTLGTAGAFLALTLLLGALLGSVSPERALSLTLSSAAGGLLAWLISSNGTKKRGGVHRKKRLRPSR